MNLLGAIHYDPGTAVDASTASGLAMTALDTTNLRLTVTVPAHGFLRIRIRCATRGGTAVPAILLGCLESSTIRGRVSPVVGWFGQGARATHDAEFPLTGLTPGSITLDAAYGVETLATSSSISYGGPNNTTGSDAWGAFIFEIWDPRPIPTAAAGAAGGLFIAGTNAPVTITGSGTALTISSTGSNGKGIDIAGNGSGAAVLATGGATGEGLKIVGGGTSGDGIDISVTSGHGIDVTATGTAKNALNLTGAAAATTNAGGHGIRAVGGAASTSSGGTAGNGFNIFGGAGAATTNGSAAGMSVTAGGTTTVAGNYGAKFTGDGNDFAGVMFTGYHGAVCSGTTSNGLYCLGGSNGLFVTGTAFGANFYCSSTGPAIYVQGGQTSGDGIQIVTTSGNAVTMTPGIGHGMSITAAGTAKNAVNLIGAAATGANAGGHGFHSQGGAASTTAGGTAGYGFNVLGGPGAALVNGPAAGVRFSGGVDGGFSGAAHGFDLYGQSSGKGLNCESAAGIAVALTGITAGISITSQVGPGIDIATVAAHGIQVVAAGTSKHGIVVTGGTAGTSDGIKAVAGTGGVPIRGDITGNITGTITSAGTVTGNVNGNVGGSVGSVTGSVGGNVTGNVGGNVTGSVGSLATQAKADVNGEVLDVLNVDTFAEIGQETPAATNTIRKMLGFLFKAWRNKKTQTSTQFSLFADDATTVDQKSTTEFNGTTTTVNEITTGP